MQNNNGKPSFVRLERDGGGANYESRIVYRDVPSSQDRQPISHGRHGASILIQIRPLVQAFTLGKIFSPISHLSGVILFNRKEVKIQRMEHLHKMRLERFSATVFG